MLDPGRIGVAEALTEQPRDGDVAALVRDARAEVGGVLAQDLGDRVAQRVGALLGE